MRAEAISAPLPAVTNVYFFFFFLLIYIHLQSPSSPMNWWIICTLRVLFHVLYVMRSASVCLHVRVKETE